MNERLKQLAIEAKLIAPEYNGFDHTRLSISQQKFAELIVAECVSIGDNYQDILGDEPECFNCRKVAYGIVDKIKEHFGVEE
jgi:hypothetical protein